VGHDDRGLPECGSPRHLVAARGHGAWLTAVRRLPPGTPLGRPERAEDRALLDALLRLPDAADPLRWLRERHGAATARRVLRWVLLQLRSDHRSVRAGGRPDLRRLPPEIQALWDDHARAWVGPPGGADPFAGLDETTDDPELLRRILRRVRAVRPRYAGPSGVLPAGDVPRLVDDLLRLPDAVDPLRWLQEERGAWGAAWLLGGLRQAVWPPHDAAGEPLRRVRPGRRVLFSGRAEFVFEEFALRTHGFSIDVTVQTFPGALPRPPGVEWLLLFWAGFDQVRDDRGHRYIAVGGGSPQQLDSQGELSRHSTDYYPAPAAGARVLTFSATPARLAGMAVPAQGPALAAPEVEAGDLVWRVNLRGERFVGPARM
jgi:hypothetical protein